MRKLILLFGMFALIASAQAQTPAPEANYELASRFSPKKLEKLVFSTSVDPHWLKKSDRFWYTFETPNGKNWYIVDPAKAEKRLMFDNEKLAAKLTAVVKDPMDAQHLNIDSLRFVKDENWIQFEVKSTEEIEKKDSVAKKGEKPVKEKKVFYFEYNLNTGELVELPDFKKPKRNPRWASVSPDGQTILFVRNFNLYWMDKANYEKALQKEDDSTIVEHKITSDGVEYFSYGSDSFFGGGETNVDKEKNKDKRKPSFVFWSPDSKHFAMVRNDVRKVKELWVVNSVADPRPTLETYKYCCRAHKSATGVARDAHTVKVNERIAVGQLFGSRFFISQAVVTQVAISEVVIPFAATWMSAAVAHRHHDEAHLRQPVGAVHTAGEAFTYGFRLRAGIYVLDDWIFFGRVEIERFIHHTIEICDAVIGFYFKDFGEFIACSKKRTQVRCFQVENLPSFAVVQH